jgi:GPH family glycoside/pentoside/hexuronide:cation symporter
MDLQSTPLRQDAIHGRDATFSKNNVRNYVAVSVLNIFIKGFGYILVSSYFTYFYSEFLGLSAAVSAGILSVGIFLDACSDFGMGIIIDRFYTRHGKARHWILWMAAPTGITMALTFWAPVNASPAGKAVYAFIMYNLYCCCMTAVRMPSQAIASLGSDNDQARTMFGWFSSAGTTLASILTAAVLVPTLQSFGGESVRGYRMTLTVFSAVTIVVIFLAGLLFHEKRCGKDWAVLSQAHQKKSLRGDLKKIFGNKYWCLYFSFHFFESCLPGILGGSLAYFCKYVLKDPAAVSTILTVTALPMILGQVLDLPLFRFFDSTRVLRGGYWLMLLGSILGCFLGASSLDMLCVSLFVRQFGSGMANGIRGGLLPRIVDYGEWKTGVRQDGMGYGGTSVLDKISSALVTLLVGAILTVTGYVGGSSVIPESAVQGIQFIFLDLPVICSAICLVIYHFFDLDGEKIRRMRLEINQRHAEAGVQ